MTELHEEVQPILNHYDLTPISVNRHGRVVKVNTSRGTYALKALSFDKEVQFLETQNLLHRNSFPTLPIFLTKYGEPLVRTNRSLYYLTPWIVDMSRHKDQKWENLMEQLARLHRRTKKEQSKEAVGNQRPVPNGWDIARMELERFAFEAEHQLYPSPFEQRFLILFHRIMADAELAYKTAETLSKPNDTENLEYRVSLCHGRPMMDHLIMSDRGTILINFDHAYWGSPIKEIAEVFQDNEIPPEYVIRLYDQYQTVNQLTINEKRQLMTELLWPYAFVQLIKSYREKSTTSELTFIEQLHRLCERRQQLQLFFNHLEKEISDESNLPLDPPLEETNIESNEQYENDDIESRRPENGSNHLEDGEG